MAEITSANNVYILTAINDEINRRFEVDRLRWVAPAAAAGNELQITEAATIGDGATVLWETFADGANYVEESLQGFKFEHGLRVDVIDSGALYV